MKHFLHTLTVLIGLHCISALSAEGVIAQSGTRIENLSGTIRQAQAWLGPSPDFEIAGRVAWLLSGDNSIVDLGSGKRVLPKGVTVHAFTRTAGGTVAVITENVLGIITGGIFLPTTHLPFGNMRVAAGPRETLLLFGGPDNDQYLLSYDGERHTTLLRTDEPIGVVTYAGDRLFFSLGNKLFTVRQGEAPSLLFLFPRGDTITGIAPNSRSGEIFVSITSAIFMLSQGIAEKKVEGIGGRLQWRDGRLYVLDPSQGVFARISF